MELVSKEIAIWLKEIGFNEQTWWYFYCDIDGVHDEVRTDGEMNHYNRLDTKLVQHISCPTISEALDWLWDNKQICYETVPIIEASTYKYCKDCVIKLTKPNEDIFEDVILETKLCSSVYEAKKDFLQKLYENRDKLELK